jgi:type II secretory pathway pseudopilin PulG
MFPSRSQYGFSTLEIIVVIGLISIILSLGTIYNLHSFTKSIVIQERDLFVSLILNKARAEALAHVHATAHGVYVNNETHEYILFEGMTYVPDASTNRKIPFTHNTITVQNENADSTYSIIFAPRSGTIIVGDGEITITNNAMSYVVTLRKTGQIDW